MSTATVEKSTFENRSYHHKDRIERLMRMDFDMLNTVLGLELNIQMSPAVLRSVLRRRLGEISVNEKKNLPGVVIEIILAVDEDHQAKEFKKYLKKRPTKEPEKKAVTVPDKMVITPIQNGVSVLVDGLKPLELARNLAAARAWPAWAYFNKVRVRLTDTSVELIGNIFAEFNPVEIRALFQKQFGL